MVRKLSAPPSETVKSLMGALVAACGLVALLSGCAAASDDAADASTATATAAAPDRALRDETPSTPSEPTAATSAAPGEAHSAGEITLSWTGGGEHQNFSYTAEQCYVGPDYVLVEGAGGPVDEPTGSAVRIFTSPAELLHETTGTYQAEGIVAFTWAGKEIVADGRTIHVGDYPQPASFTYRHTDDGIKYVLSWFDGSGDAGAGAVEVRCFY